ncbi:MAG: type II secretion system protein [Fimbriimonadaceae bacterium]|nr:type II secretion system protein [Fimbriimonadaceae bacterium]
MKRYRFTGFTLIEILVSLAILGILMVLLMRPVLMGLEVLSIGRGEQQSQVISRQVVNQLNDDLQGALKAYSNLTCYDLSTAGGVRWRTVQTARLDLVLPARDAQGKLLTPPHAANVGGNPDQPVVVSYWRMRHDPQREYDPQLNPYRLYRAVHSYDATALANTARTPDELWNLALSLGQPLAAVGADAAYGPLFSAAGPFNWLICDLDRLNPSAANRILRSPTAGAAETNATGIGAVTALTPQESDVRSLSFLPAQQTSESLARNTNGTAYRGRLNRWVQPYQRETPNGSGQPVWVLPAGDVVNLSSGGTLPVVAAFRASASRSALLSEEYFISLDQTPGAPTEGHPILYRMPQDTSVTADPIPVYDLTRYPTRVFGAPPGSANSGEFGCGLNWESGELVTSFPQRDVICPAPNFAEARIHAESDPASTAAPTLPLYQGGSNSPNGVWQSLELTTRAPDGTPQVGVNGSLLDDYVLDAAGAAAGVWDSYTVSVCRPERLASGTDRSFSGTPSVGDRQLNMSLVPGSEQVVVVQYDVAAVSDVATASPVRRLVYQPLRTTVAGAVNAGDLAPFRYHLDPSSGRLTFYDAQQDQDATTTRDGLNPPAVVAGGNNGLLVPVIWVTYEYRNNLPTVADLLLGEDTVQDVVQATYRSLQAIELGLTLDVPVESTRGEDESYSDPLASAPIERPTGARKRVTIATTIPVGSRL